jgi:hypothetical protein
MPPKNPTKGYRFGGRKKGTPNKATVLREEAARAEIAAALESGRKAGKGQPRIALDDAYRLAAICEGIAGKCQPRDIVRDEAGKITIIGGDLEKMGEWIDRLWLITKELLKYQVAPMKAIDMPAPPPDPAALERNSHRRFGLRVFDGGRQITPLKPINGNGNGAA